jgi:hypothetical protein
VVERVPFKHLKACPVCGRIELKIIHKQMIPEQDGIHQLVIYKCPNGHQPRKKQLVIKQEGVPPKELWEGYAT